MANNQDGDAAVIEDIFDPADLPFGVNVAVGVRLRVDKGNRLGLPFTQQLELLLRRVPKHCHDVPSGYGNTPRIHGNIPLLKKLCV